MASIVFNKDMSERREYVCHTCAKAFKRSEHCIRHQRAHTNEKPFQCRFCDRRYARKDLVCRHEKTLHAEGLAARRQSLATQKDAESPARPEVLQAEDDENHSHNDDNGSPNRASEFPGPVPPASPPVLMSGPEFALPEISPRNYSSGSPPQHVTVDSTMFAFSASDTDEALLVDTSYISAPVENPSPFRNTLDHFDFTGPFSDFPMVPLASFNNDGFLASADLVSLHRDLQSENLDFSVAHNINAGLHANALTPPHTGPDQDGICQRQGAAGQSRYAPTMYQSPDVVYVDLPIIAKTPHSKPLCPRVTDSHRERLVDQILLQGSTFGDFSESDLPKATLLSQYLRTFVDSFGVHMPFIHVPTFCPGSAHGALILVMCAIGALMRLEQEVATRLSIHADLLMQPEAVKHIQHDHGSKRFKHLVVPSKEVDPAACLPVWFVQSKLLITWFRAFTGNPHVVAQALNDTAFLVSVRSSSISFPSNH
ncbi:hypothetical protein D6D20_09459 [Aureobasidium pullulans]|uniref:C2H2-type domain-containing protein n=1 Tax=Aureobasidium pullulans TaxID=5580 RepID=A0A4V4ILS4_AURPU|nr:hypothetical protein D6D20_09459 [Aureobasidium pullulans]